MLSICSYVPLLSLSDGARRWRRDTNPENRKLSLDPKNLKLFAEESVVCFCFVVVLRDTRRGKLSS